MDIEEREKLLSELLNERLAQEKRASDLERYNKMSQALVPMKCSIEKSISIVASKISEDTSVEEKRILSSSLLELAQSLQIINYIDKCNKSEKAG